MLGGMPPVDSGNLRRQIQLVWITPFHCKIISNANYSAAVEYGTKPHIIRPVSAKALHWKSGGKDFFAKSVNHPGCNSQPFMRPARNMAEIKFKNFIK